MTATAPQPIDYRKLRIVFMGTPEFAVASLDALVQAGCSIVGVVTAPDKPAGRGMQLRESAVKSYALAHQLPVLQPIKLRDPAFLQELQNLQADLQVVVAFRMLPELVWKMPPLGTINVHGSLLPRYRGAAPINWAVINGETETGVTTFQLQHEIDTGGILLQEAFSIGPDETAGEVHDRMKEIGARLLVTTIQEMAAGTLTPHPQPAGARGTDFPHAPKLFTDTCRIHFDLPVTQVHNLVRGLSPFPGAFTTLQGKILKIFRSDKEEVKPAQPPGSVVTDGKQFLRFACADGYLLCREVQLEGKKKMGIEEFLRGYRPDAGNA